MNSRSDAVVYSCLNACGSYGSSPEHSVVAVYSHVSDTLAFEVTTDGKVKIHHFDENEFKAFIEAYRGIKW